MGNSKSDLSNGAGSGGNDDSDPRKKELDTAKVVAAVGVGALAAWGIKKLVSSSSSSGLEEENNCVIFKGKDGRWEDNDGKQDIWRFPARGKLKMNTDGSVTESQPHLGGRAGFGVVIRDESGSWIMGFYGRLKDCPIADAELLAIYKGLKIIQGRNFRKVFEIESDCKTVVDLINGKNHTKKTSMKDIVEECKVMLLDTGCTLKYIDNDANHVADEMAKVGRNQDKDIVPFSSPPELKKIVSSLTADVASARSILGSTSS